MIRRPGPSVALPNPRSGLRPRRGGSRGLAGTAPAAVILVAVAALLLPVAGGCGGGRRVSNDSSPPPARPGRAVESSIVGVWLWRMTTGGFAGVRRTPESTGESWTLVLMADGTYRSTRSGGPPAAGTYTVEKRASRLDGDRPAEPALIVEGELDRLISFPDDSILVLRENVTDGFVHRFARTIEP